MLEECKERHTKIDNISNNVTEIHTNVKSLMFLAKTIIIVVSTAFIGLICNNFVKSSLLSTLEAKIIQNDKIVK